MKTRAIWFLAGCVCCLVIGSCWLRYMARENQKEIAQTEQSSSVTVTSRIPVSVSDLQGFACLFDSSLGGHVAGVCVRQDGHLATLCIAICVQKDGSTTECQFVFSDLRCKKSENNSPMLFERTEKEY